MITKAFYHFEFLKELHPEKFREYKNYFDTYNFEAFNKYRFILIFPYFNHNVKKSEDQELIRLGNRVKLLCRLVFVNIGLMVLYVTFLLVMF